ncbi:MAG: hypothetical protein NZ551_04090 [Microscillaceae bacterium]|nr:hypothetical protein [Microscillaceae bacterium]MDW8460371.1 hypothetical protein [Cytophagales bacterium]
MEEQVRRVCAGAAKYKRSLRKAAFLPFEQERGEFKEHSKI